MVKYSVKRLLQSFVTIFLVLSIVFLLIRLMPDSGYFDAATWAKASDQVKLTILQQHGIYDANGQKINPFVQLLNFYKRLFTSLDFGASYKLQYGVPVTKFLADKAPYSIAFGSVSTFFVLLLGYTIGVLMAQFKDKAFDKIMMGYIIIVIAAPAVVYYFILQNYITLWTGWPMIFKKGNNLSWITPLIIMSATGLAGQALWVRRYMVNEINADYVKLAYAKGLPSRKVMFSHVLRNAVVPMAYGLPGAFIGTISGSILIESLFAIPGMGGQLIRAITERDNNVVQYIVFIYATLGILSVLLGDLLAVAFDPRIRLTSKGGKSR